MDADRVLLVGGMDEGQFLNTTEILHLDTLTVTPGPEMKSERFWCTAVALDTRRILVVGGCNGRADLSSTEILNLDTMAFAPGPAMATKREGCAAVALDEHRIMVVGGDSGDSGDAGSLAKTEVLDIRKMAFAPGPSMGSSRGACAAVPVDAQHVLVIGGQDTHCTSLDTTELLDLAKMEFAPGPTMQARRYACTAARADVAGEPRILVIGGGHGRSAMLTTEVLAV